MVEYVNEKAGIYVLAHYVVEHVNERAKICRSSFITYITCYNT